MNDINLDKNILLKTRVKSVTLFLLVTIPFVIFFYYLFIPPLLFNVFDKDGVLIEIKKGSNAKIVATMLKQKDVISSEAIFVGMVSLLGHDNKINPGTYLFKKPLNIFSAEKRIVDGDFGIPAKRITIPEGFSNLEIANRLDANIESFDKNSFMNMAYQFEGYLYPETYFFIASDDEDIILNKMRQTFDEKTKPLAHDFESSNKSREDIIIMASILEMEVQSKEDKKIVSGILWNRIEIGMPLQVDATLAYERNKNSYTLTTQDLRTDSTYNTYTRRGLPPTPISNPGFDAIEAALNPTQNDFLYFLTDKEGKVYYAKTYTEHLKNKANYFNK